MDDLISRGAAINAVCQGECGKQPDELANCDYFNDKYGGCSSIQALRALPSVDTVEVVRCSDCTYNENMKTWCWCQMFNATVKPDGFCYAGKTKKGSDRTMT